MNQFDYRTATSIDIARHLRSKHKQTFFRMHQYHTDEGHTEIVLKLERARLLTRLADAQEALDEFDALHPEVG